MLRLTALVGFKPIAAVKGTTAAIKGEVTARIVGYGDMKYPPLNSAFITFHRQIAAHLAVQVLAHHDPYRMSMPLFTSCSCHR
jgi:hypothetical protein